MSQGTSVKQVGASKLPTGCARHERTRSPRANQANEVVIPQVGQGRPVAA